MNKVFASADEAVRDIQDGAMVMVGGFGLCGIPEELIEALARKGVKNLTTVSNNAGVDTYGLGKLLQAGQIKKHIGSYVGENKAFEQMVLSGKVQLELNPQGTLAERVRAGGAGIPAFFTPTGAGTLVAEGKEQRIIGGRECILETALRADFAVVRAHRADRHGNLVYRRGARNLHPPFATGGGVTLAEVDEVVETLDPECVVTPGIYVDRVVATEHPLDVERIRALSRQYGRAVHVEPRPDLGGIPADLMARRAARCL